MGDNIRFSVTKMHDNKDNNNRWRAYSRDKNKTFFADHREALWCKMKKELGASSVCRRRGKWIVLFE